MTGSVSHCQLTLTLDLCASRSLSEDSGFGSLGHDKSQDSLREHDGSFQELLLSSSGLGAETLPLSDGKRRSRLQRQQRLSTLREGGSQSEEDGRHIGQTHPGVKCLSMCHSPCKVDEVFLVTDTTPSGSKIGRASCRERVYVLV